MAADAILGLAAGNRIQVKISYDNITNKSQLPDGIIVKTTNKSKPSGYNEYTKDAFESDGSLIDVQNVSAQDPHFVVKIKWVEGLETTYRFNLNNATFETL